VRFELTCNVTVEFDGFAEQSRTDSLRESGPEQSHLGGYLIPFPLLCLHKRSENRTGSTIFTTTLDSPVGTLHLAASNTALLAVVWRRHSTPQLPFAAAVEAPAHPVLLETIRQLTEYFRGLRRIFDLPLDFQGTNFQRQVWSSLLSIPFGETRSYLDVARALGNAAGGGLEAKAWLLAHESPQRDLLAAG
jgi:hypothetical protein